MPLFRAVAVALPQLLLLLFLAGSNDLLGGWNQGDAAMGLLLILFLLSPVVLLALLVVEFARCCKARPGARLRAGLFIGLAIVFLVESLGIDFYLLTQVRM